MLEVEGIEAAYGDSQVLFGVSLDVRDGEMVTLLGRNGMGKTTTIGAIMGLLPVKAGRIGFDGTDLTGTPPYRAARAGLGLVPEGRQIFPTLSVEENLVATAAPPRNRTPGWTLDGVYTLFPRLAERRRNMGSQISGGEQQMVAIARALMTNPKLLILDEATEGLAPIICEEIWSCLERLKADGQSILIVDKNVDVLARLADRHMILEKGRIVWAGTSAELKRDPQLTERYLLV
ncbi:ABC transporter ATP-binding protein [Kaustia mangrovi]|uniref:ABC transporter ATP-binding protein n=1 Tax=Kaustia mangrovi TaxID=2593653 RepID=A0A7S8C4D3_9HYPH|nr:ABC transporter ATP-binding protein [Kaustia mangrovi]QPC43164.1 ABC transporter ATP-binding protein [Kaustia mangrovi]